MPKTRTEWWLNKINGNIENDACKASHKSSWKVIRLGLKAIELYLKQLLDCTMKKPKVYSLCEAVADISYMAAKENYRTQDSREMISQFIEWAQEFKY